MTSTDGLDSGVLSVQQQQPPPDETAPLPLPLPQPPHRRRRTWLVLGIVLAVLVAAIALVGYLMVDRSANRSGGTGGGTATNPPAAAPTTAGAQPAQPTAPAPTGGIPRAELLNGTFDIPAWPADTPWPASAKMTKQVHFTDGRSATGPDGAYVAIRKVTYVDVNRDNSLETLALLSLTAQGSSDQVAVFTRNASGSIVPFGQVVATHPNGPRGVIKTIADLRPAANGRVDVQVGDDVPCCGVEPGMVLYQWRTYGWTGSAFVQVGGPTAFGVDTRFPNLVLAPTQISLGAPVSGVRHGVLALTISTHGTVAAGRMKLAISLSGTGLTPEGPGWTGYLGGSSWDTTMAAPAPGHSVTLRLGVSRPVSQDGATGAVQVRLWPLDELGNLSKDGWFDDNDLAVPVRVAA